MPVHVVPVDRSPAPASSRRTSAPPRLVRPVMIPARSVMDERAAAAGSIRRQRPGGSHDAAEPLAFARWAVVMGAFVTVVAAFSSQL